MERSQLEVIRGGKGSEGPTESDGPSFVSMALVIAACAFIAGAELYGFLKAAPWMSSRIAAALARIDSPLFYMR